MTHIGFLVRVQVATSGTPTTLRIAYEAYRPVEQPIFSFAVEDMAGILMANPEIRTAELEPGLVVYGRGHIDYVIPELSLALVYMLMAAVLIIKPSGLFGEKQ